MRTKNASRLPANPARHVTACLTAVRTAQTEQLRRRRHDPSAHTPQRGAAAARGRSVTPCARRSLAKASCARAQPALRAQRRNSRCRSAHELRTLYSASSSLAVCARERVRRCTQVGRTPPKTHLVGRSRHGEPRARSRPAACTRTSTALGKQRTAAPEALCAQWRTTTSSGSCAAQP